jgi:nitrite reductase/ring-hydroxylating ferredoxin subunit
MDNFSVVTTLKDLAVSPMSRIHLQIKGRNVSVILRNNQVFCMDSICCHMGGPLAAGDIEDVDGELAIKCPWHSYRFSLLDGKKFSRPVTFDADSGSPSCHGWSKSDVTSQRVHDVVVDEKGSVSVRLVLERGDSIPSDRYAYDSNAAACLHKACSQYFHSNRY